MQKFTRHKIYGNISLRKTVEVKGGVIMLKLPLEIDLDTVDILRQLSVSNNRIGYLDALIRLLPNPNIILNVITLGEAKSSSEIENIITTYDELYKEMVDIGDNQSAKEVLRYKSAITHATNLINDRGIISTNDIVSIHKIIEPNKGSIRPQGETVLKNESTGEIVNTPPQSEKEIRDELQKLESYINNSSLYDPLVDMAVIHYQFETIHPFYDGNGRIGRILNVAYLILKNKITLPILYLSKYIIEHKSQYYSLLASIQKNPGNLTDFVLFMLKGIEEMADFTIDFINLLNQAIEDTAEKVKEQLPKIYSEELIHILFQEFYTKNEYFRDGLSISRPTSTKYLNQLVEIGVLESRKSGKELIYINKVLFSLLEQW